MLKEFRDLFKPIFKSWGDSLKKEFANDLIDIIKNSDLEFDIDLHNENEDNHFNRFMRFEKVGDEIHTKCYMKINGYWFVVKTKESKC